MYETPLGRQDRDRPESARPRRASDAAPGFDPRHTPPQGPTREPTPGSYWSRRHAEAAPEELLPPHPHERAPDDSWLNKLGPAQPGQRHPDTGEVPLYQQQLDEPVPDPAGYEPAPEARGFPGSPRPGSPNPGAPLPQADLFSERAMPETISRPGGPESLRQPFPADNLPLPEALAPRPETFAPSVPTGPQAPPMPGPGPGPGPFAPPGLPLDPAPFLHPEGLSTQELGLGSLDDIDDLGDDLDGTRDRSDQVSRAKVPALPHLNGLDGLRGLALLAVLAFAADISQVRGGFLGISTAFTLTGFLLTTKALTEWGETSRLALADLWQRRAERLVPAYYFTIALVVVLQLTVRVGSVPGFRNDVWGALGFATNWQLAYPGDGFTRMFQDLSALQHLWPVAVLVQLMLVVPLAFSALMAVTSRTWRTAAAVFAAACVASFVAAWYISSQPEGHNVAYYGTHTRAGELLAGVVLAYLVMTPRFRAFVRQPLVLSVIRNGGLPALAALLVLWARLPFDSELLFQGGTLLNAALTGWLVLAVTMPGPTTTALGLLPLRKLGEISFCAYLLHGPLFLLLDEDRTSLDGPALFGVRLIVTLVAAVGVAWVIETTFRRRVELPRLHLGAGLGLTAAIVAVLVVILPVNAPANISLSVDDGGDQPGQLDVVAPTGGGREAARVLVVGDESASSVVPGFAAWNEENPEAQLRVDTHVADGCPLGGPWNTRRFGETVEPSIDCIAWPFRLPKTLDAADYDVVLVSMGAADLGEREVQRDWRSLGDPTLDQWMSSQIDGLADRLADPEAPVLWLTLPEMHLLPSDPESGQASWTQYEDNNPDRVRYLNSLIRSTLDGRSDFTVVDFDHWLQPQEFDPAVRAGAELTEVGARSAANWLAPQILAATGVEYDGAGTEDPATEEATTEDSATDGGSDDATD